MQKKVFIKTILLFIFIIYIYSIKSYCSSSDFTYKLDSNNYATITSYKGSNNTITIPSTIDGYTVKKISDHAFDENRNDTNGKILTHVTISDGITDIGDFAFIDCINLETLTLPESLVSLGDQTFIGCTKLNKINIPSKVNQIQNYVFQQTSFTEFVIPEHFKRIGTSAFRLCSKLKTFKVYSRDVVYDDDIFQYCSKDLVLYGYEGSTTQSYAKKNGLKFIDLSNESKNILVDSITLNKTSLSLHIGDSETLIPTILPTNSSNKEVIWSSSNTNIAIVESGKVTAKNVGSAIITATTVDGNKKITCNIEVLEKKVIANNNTENINSTTNNTNTTNNNNNNNNNNSTIKNTDNNTKKTIDNSVSKTKLPQTGLANFIIIIIFIMLISMFISYMLYKNLRDV